MLIKMLKLTNFNGVKNVGTIHNIAPEIANRWIRTGIAELASTKSVNESEEINIVNENAQVEQEPEIPKLVVEKQEVENKELNYSEMSAKELYDLCLKKSLNVEQRKSKAYYIDALNGILSTDVAETSTDEQQNVVEE